jgi:hypothetical protein
MDEQQRNFWGDPRLPKMTFPGVDNDVYLDKLQTRGVKKSILYM